MTAFANLDHERLARQGFPEVVLAEAKTPAQVAAIVGEFVDRAGCALATRASPAHFAAVAERLPHAHYDPCSRLITVGQLAAPPELATHRVAVICAGTSDLPVAEECAGTLDWAGVPVQRHYDIGVARLERLLAVEAELREASVCVVVAGMEGALPTVVGSRIACPVIAVPTSVGYGASFGGISALLGMLTSCVPGVTVVNIDNGFGAAAAANRMLRLAIAHHTAGATDRARAR
ncbi:MAG TPA: nickel pincer cofactor biosynthesis protein LarB [Pseudomonadales bacterium]